MAARTRRRRIANAMATGIRIRGTAGPALAGVAYSFVPKVSRGVAPLAFARTGAALPAGFAFSAATGAITGTTAVLGTFAGTITVTDSTGATAALNYSIRVTEEADELTLSGTAPDGVEGAFYSFVPGVSGGTAPFSFAWAGSALAPFGLAISPATGELSSDALLQSGGLDGSITVSDAAGASATLPVDIEVTAAPSIPFAVVHPTSFFGASNISGVGGDGVTVVTVCQEEPGLADTNLLYNRGIGSQPMNGAPLMANITADGAQGRNAIFQWIGSNDTSTDPDARIGYALDQIAALGHDRWGATTSFHVTDPVQSPGFEQQRHRRFCEKAELLWPGRLTRMPAYTNFPDLFPSIDGSGNPIADNAAATTARNGNQIVASLTDGTNHMNGFGYRRQAATTQRPLMLAMATSYRFPSIPMGQEIYSADPAMLAPGGYVVVPWYSPHGDDALANATISVLATNGMDSHFAASKVGGDIRLTRISGGLPGGQSICEVWLRVAVADVSYDVLQFVLLGQPGAFGMVRHSNATRAGYMPLAGAATRQGSLLATFVPPPGGADARLLGSGGGGFAVRRSNGNALLMSMFTANGATQIFGSALSHAAVTGNPAVAGNVWAIGLDVDFDHGGAEAGRFAATVINPAGVRTKLQSTATIGAGEIVDILGMRRFFHSVPNPIHRADWQIGVIWASTKRIDFQTDANFDQFISAATKRPNTAAGQLGAAGNSTGAVTIGGVPIVPELYLGYGNAADVYRGTNWGSGQSGENGRSWCYAPRGGLLDVA